VIVSKTGGKEVVRRSESLLSNLSTGGFAKVAKDKETLKALKEASVLVAMGMSLTC